MSPRRDPVDLGASVRARLRNLARERHVEFQLVLSEFAIERLLYRLGASEHAERFVLKGATLFRLWSNAPGRVTWDLDLMGRGPKSVDDVLAAFRQICGIHVKDGIVFDATSMTGEEISVPDEYSGVRARLEATVAEAAIPVQIDVGFGDAIVPPPRRETYPAMLDQPAPRVLVYPRETVVAEKVEAMVSLGVTNSRMKDFYDLDRLAALFAFNGNTLVRSIRATFERRKTELPTGEPLVLEPGFLTAAERQIQWRALLRRGRLEGPQDAGDLVDNLRRFLLPVLAAASRRETAFDAEWRPGGPWQAHEERTQ